MELHSVDEHRFEQPEYALGSAMFDFKMGQGKSDEFPCHGKNHGKMITLSHRAGR